MVDLCLAGGPLPYCDDVLCAVAACPRSGSFSLPTLFRPAPRFAYCEASAFQLKLSVFEKAREQRLHRAYQVVRLLFAKLFRLLDEARKQTPHLVRRFHQPGSVRPNARGASHRGRLGS